MHALRFELATLPPETEALRGEIRAFLAAHLGSRPAAQRALSWTDFDSNFSRALGAAGFIGLTYPTHLGGRGRSQLDRYVVIEELLAAGAPVAAHWISDRQSGPLLLRYGSAALQSEFVPEIARGEAYFCIGMSEPNSGSDLASVSTFAERVDGGYRVQGSKLWGTHVTRCRYMVALVRTARTPEKHAGLSQLLIDLEGPGIEVRPIVDLAGHEHFGEVRFEDAFVPSSRLIGTEGQGWQQVMAELAFERSGPERYLSSFELLSQLVARAALNNADPVLVEGIGSLWSSLSTLRQMSLSVAARLQTGEDVGVHAALVKELGTSFEQMLPEVAHALLGIVPMQDGGDLLARVHGTVSLLAPSYSLRGGTREILRGIIAKELLR